MAVVISMNLQMLPKILNALRAFPLNSWHNTSSSVPPVMFMTLPKYLKDVTFSMSWLLIVIRLFDLLFILMVFVLSVLMLLWLDGGSIGGLIGGGLLWSCWKCSTHLLLWSSNVVSRQPFKSLIWWLVTLNLLDIFLVVSQSFFILCWLAAVSASFARWHPCLLLCTRHGLSLFAILCVLCSGSPSLIASDWS